MKTLCLFLVSAFIVFYPLWGMAGDPPKVDLSSPQAAYATCYGTLDLTSSERETRTKIKKCLTPVAQKAVLSYAVMGAHFIDSLKDLHGNKKYPEFLPQINAVLNRHELLGGSRMAFKQADLAQVISDILPIYAAHPFTSENLQYTKRELEKLEVLDDTATGYDSFKLKMVLPTNRLELRFVKADDQWMINYITPQHGSK